MIDFKEFIEKYGSDYDKLLEQYNKEFPKRPDFLEWLRIKAKEEKSKKVENKITFKQTSETRVAILLDGNEVGDVWSQLSDGGKSYDGDGTIQICGFKRVSDIWSCGRYRNKDMCVDFKDEKS